MKKSGLSVLIAMKSKPKAPEGSAEEEAMEDPQDEQVESDSTQSTEQESGTEKPMGGGMPVIEVPKSFQPPEDKQMGQEFTFTATGYMNKDGKLCLTSIGDIPFSDTETPAEDSGEDEGGETPDDAYKASAAPSNAQDEGTGGGMASTPHMQESKRLRKMLNGR